MFPTTTHTACIFVIYMFDTACTFPPIFPDKNHWINIKTFEYWCCEEIRIGYCESIWNLFTSMWNYKAETWFVVSVRTHHRTLIVSARKSGLDWAPFGLQKFWQYSLLDMLQSTYGSVTKNQNLMKKLILKSLLGLLNWIQKLARQPQNSFFWFFWTRV